MRGERGATLLEVMVAGVIVALMSVGIAHAWRFVGGSTVKLRDRARAIAELQMAVEYLRSDLGGAARAGLGRGGRLRIERPAAVAAVEGGSSVVEYRLDGGRLIRGEPDLGRETVAALDLTAFTVRRDPGGEVTIRLETGRTATRYGATLVWLP